MQRELNEIGNRDRERGINGKGRQQPRPGSSESDAAAIVSDREEKRNLDGEESERTLEGTVGPSQGTYTGTNQSQQSALTALSTEPKSEEETAIPSARSPDERLGPSDFSLRPQTAPFVKPCGNTDKCEETSKSCVASTTSEGNTLPLQSCGNVPSGSGDGQEVTNLAAKLGSNLSMQGTMETQMPSNPFTPIGQALFPMDGQDRPIEEGCHVKSDLDQSLNDPSQWKASLVNIDVSAKGFYQSQPVTEFVCETLGVQNLEDRKIQIDKEKLKKAISGVLIETTHTRWKYRVLGISNQSAEKLHFGIEDEASKVTTKTTVAGYFLDTYGLELRYPHLPCLQVRQEKYCFLPMEVCDVIPCQKRLLSKQQIANMIRSTVRPAPEQQEKIQLWLGPQDKGLTPGDGSWDMRNQAVVKSAKFDMWALVCFAGCNEDPLRNFCHQMSILSNREGMTIVAEPTLITFGRGPEEVERLFFDCLEQFPALQLIMVVLPGFDKILYSEVKRVGDIVIGISTQCVQMKHVEQTEPEVCANISLKINVKLGRINHVLDDAVKPVFNEPTIVFGAHVSYPSPTENGIPSIAAVVASMDYHALEYQARVRIQKHENGRGSPKIIIDLAEIVKELLIEFIEVNKGRKPSKILFYRNGVSDGQFDQVLVHEVRAVQEACMKLEKSYRPRITFVVVQKRHHSRLSSEIGKEASVKAPTVSQETTVDSGIKHPYEFHFSVCSHDEIQGTSRPTHCYALYDDNNFTADSLRQLTYKLCHVYPWSTQRVALPAPAYHAHSAASHARVHVMNGNSLGSFDLEECTRAFQVNDKLKGSMYFI
ncbi:protein argonaute-2-like isoform X6 [Acropora millepora]|uniref:protein argonaute-2-like isoform X6 n=1 Tax=Acropora millepora TaxID=45264 RepID=UPI001CF5F695|nr:protein argonaute-2-like isoform X6 [Acropora millepora]